MKIEQTPIEGLLILTPRRYVDARGSFEETWRAEQFNEAVGREVHFVQDNESRSAAGVLRGLHYQSPPFAQGKLVRVSSGAAWDVAVDLRAGSPTFGQHHAMRLDAELGLNFWIPEGFAHGFLALEEGTVFNYKCTARYDAASECSLRWDDSQLAIDWHLDGLHSAPVLSLKDASAPNFSDFKPTT